MVSGIGGTGNSGYVYTAGTNGITEVKHETKKNVDEIINDFKSGKIKLGEALQYLQELGATNVKISTLSSGMIETKFELNGKTYTMSTNAESVGQQTGTTKGSEANGSESTGSDGTRGAFVTKHPEKFTETEESIFEGSITVIPGTYNSEDEAYDGFNNWIMNGDFGSYIIEALGLNPEDVKNIDLSNITYDITNYKLCKDENGRYYIKANVDVKCNYKIETERDWKPGDIRRDEYGTVWQYEEDGSWTDVTNKASEETYSIQNEISNFINSLDNAASTMSSGSATNILNSLNEANEQYNKLKEKLQLNGSLYNDSNKINQNFEENYDKFSIAVRNAILDKIRQGDITEDEYEKCISTLGELEPLRNTDFSKDITDFMNLINKVSTGVNMNKETFDKLFDAFMAGKHLSITDGAQMKNELYEAMKNGKINSSACENIKEKKEESEELDNLKDNLIKDLKNLMETIKTCIKNKDIEGLKQLFSKLPNILTNLQKFADSAGNIEYKYGDSIVDMQSELNVEFDNFFNEIDTLKKQNSEIFEQAESSITNTIKNEVQDVLGGITLSMSDIFSVADTLFADSQTTSVENFVNALKQKYGKNTAVDINTLISEIDNNTKYSTEDKEKLHEVLENIKTEFGKNVSVDVIINKLTGSSNKITNLIGDNVLKQFNIDGEKIDQTAISNAIVNYAKKTGTDLSSIKISANELVAKLKEIFGDRTDISKEEFEEAIIGIYTEELGTKAIDDAVYANGLEKQTSDTKTDNTSINTFLNHIHNELLVSAISNCKNAQIVNKFVDMLGTLGKIMKAVAGNDKDALNQLIAELEQQTAELKDLLDSEYINAYGNDNKQKEIDDAIKELSNAQAAMLKYNK